MSLFILSRRQMLFVLVCSAALHLVAATCRAEKVPKPAETKPPVNKTAEVEWGGKWYPVQVLEEKDGKFFVHYDTYTDASNEWVTKDRVRFPGKPKGETRCEVEWGGKWYPAQVIAENDSQWKIKYDNYDDASNEWVGKDRIRFPTKTKVAPPQKCEVEWNGTWFPSQVLEEKDGKFYIKYDGYGDNWNEWVGKDRVKFPAKPKPATPAKAEVEWHGTWYPAQVLEEKDGKFYIKYDGYGDNWNEWVGKERIKISKEEKK